MIYTSTVLVVVLMAMGTYFTRIAGFLLLRNRSLSPRVLAVLENVPGCVLLSVIAPSFVSSNPADLIALVITLIAMQRCGLLLTVMIGVASAGLLRYVTG